MDQDTYTPLADDESPPEMGSKRVRYAGTRKSVLETTTYVETPLSDGLRGMIGDELARCNVDGGLIGDIEGVCDVCVGTELYNRLIELLQPHLHDDTKRVVGRILLFKKKMCKNGNGCENIEKCIFVHNIANDVILNRITEDIGEEQIRKYAEEYGTVSLIRPINAGKYLVRYECISSAIKCIKDGRPVLGSDKIKKFFNRRKVSSTALFREQDVLLMRLFNDGHKKLALQLKNTQNKIKEYIKNLETV